MTSKCALWIFCLAGLLISPSGWTQTPAPEKTAPETSKLPVYEDRLIDAGNLPPLAEDKEDLSYNAEGPSRAWRIEGVTSNFDRGGVVRRENGLTFGGRFDTQDYGAFSLDGAFRSRPSAGVFTLGQRGLAFDNGWRANNGAGMLNTPGIDLSRNQYRFFLPTFPIVGVETEWLHDGDVQIQASAGQPGLFDGLRLSGFSRRSGNIFTAGAQWVVAPNVLAGFQFADAQGVGNNFDVNAADARISARSWYGTMAWQDAKTRVQVNLLDSEVNQGRHNLGFWLDAETREGRYRYNYGVFRNDPDLSWGYSPFTADIQGAYFRVNYQSQQWMWSGGLDDVNSVSGRGADGVYGTGSVRYQVNRSLGVGGGATVRRSNDNAEAAYAFVDKLTSLGTTRVQLDVASTTGSQRNQQFAVDQAWPTEVGLRLSTSLSLTRETTPEKRIHRANFGINGGADISNNLTLEGSVRWSTSRDIANTRGMYANVSLNWRISSRWALSMTYYDNRAEDQTTLSVASLIPTQLLVPLPRDRALFLILRYEDHAGTPLAPLGGAAGSGAGNIVGYLFLDANENERRDANEFGAANVTILLDGKFSTRTDAQGKFEFPMVVNGTHTISVVPDNLPLPYFVGADGKRQIVVRTRETTMVDIPASTRK